MQAVSKRRHFLIPGCGCYWLPSLYHWLGLITAIIAFLMYYLFPWTIRTTVEGGGEHSEPFRLWVKILFPLLVAIIWLAAWLAPYLLLRGSINENDGEDYQMMSLDFSPDGHPGTGPMAQISCGRYMPSAWPEAVGVRPGVSVPEA